MSSTQHIVATAAQTRRLEEAAVAAGSSWAELMERAGTGVAAAVEQELARLGGTRGAAVLVLVGPGNNGGDGLVAARLLHDAGAGVTLYVWKRRPDADDANWRQCRERNIAELRAEDDTSRQALRAAAVGATIILDALLGTGVSRPLDAQAVQIVETIDRARAERTHTTPLVVAVDVPTGVDADRGAIMGAALRADLTVATGILKRGHVLGPGRERAGRVVVAPIGLAVDTEETHMAESLTGQAMRKLLPARPADSNKGTFGKVLVVAGAGRYPGAAFLSASGALRSGAGLITLACGRSIFGALAASLHEATYLPLPEADWGVLGVDAVREISENAKGYQSWVVGPGIGREDETHKFLQRLLRIETPAEDTGIGFFRATSSAAAAERKAGSRPVGFGRSAEPEAAKAAANAEPAEQASDAEPLPPVVLDADALFLLSNIDEWWTRLPEGRLILTPHPGEMARLLKLNDAREVNDDRVGAALRAAEEWKQLVVLKGAETVVAAPDGKAAIGPAGNPALATAGTGDVLSGVIGGLLAQGLEPFDAARLGVWLHAAAGKLVRDEVGEAGALAGDLLVRLPRAIGELRG